jgi:hypothetical protein
MSRIFISYRRNDSAYIAAEIRRRLQQRFGSESIFFDVDDVPLGVDFRTHISSAVGKCDVLLAIIGDKWIEPEPGKQRLEDPADYVRIEVESALSRAIPVIPVLVANAEVPSDASLPDSLKGLRYRNAAEVRAGRDLEQHLERLIKGVEMTLRSTALGPQNLGGPVSGVEPQTDRSVPSAPLRANIYVKIVRGVKIAIRWLIEELVWGERSRSAPVTPRGLTTDTKGTEHTPPPKSDEGTARRSWLIAVNPITLIREAVEAVPAMRYVLAVLAMVAVIPIVIAWNVDLRIALGSAVVVLFLMVAVVVFAKLTKTSARHFLRPIMVLMWSGVILVVVFATSLFFAAAFGQPPGLAKMFFGDTHPHASHREFDPSKEATWTAEEKEIFSLQRQILQIKESYELMKTATPEAKLLAINKIESGLRLAVEMLAIKDDKVALHRQVNKYTYAALAYYMVAYVLQDKARKKEYSKIAVECADKSLSLLEQLRVSAHGKQPTQMIIYGYGFSVKDSALDRTKYYKAVAMAINVVAGGEYSASEVKKIWESISTSYRTEFPVNNDDLEKVLDQ